MIEVSTANLETAGNLMVKVVMVFYNIKIKIGMKVNGLVIWQMVGVF